MQIAGGRKAMGGSPFSFAGGRKSLLVAVVLGLLAAVLARSYVQRAGQGARQAALVPVVVAAQDIGVRTPVTAAMLTIKQIPADARHPLAFTGLEQIDGKVTNLPISAGEQVLSTKFFERKEDSGLAFRVPSGRRALSVGVNEVVTSGGLIVPGDYVDVISTFAGDTPAQDSASIVLQNIQVLAIAQSIQGPGEAPSGPAAVLNGNQKNAPAPPQEAVARPNARTATLAVTPEEAERLILAEEKGKIRLALRGMEDRDVNAVAPVQLQQIKR